MATYSSILAWRIPWKEEPDRLQSMGVTKSRTQLSDFHLIMLKEGWKMLGGAGYIFVLGHKLCLNKFQRKNPTYI